MTKHNLVVERIRRQIENFSPATLIEEVGTILSVGDGVAHIDGLSGAVMSEMLRFDEAEGKPLEESLKAIKNPLYAVVLNLEEEGVKAIILGDSARVREGMTVSRLHKVLSIPVGDALIGRVVNALGAPIDGNGDIATSTEYSIEREAYGVIERAPVNVPLHTGIKAIDGMIPIGRGQRELIIGDRFTGKTTIAIDTILNQLNEPAEKRPICVYVAIGQKESKVARIRQELKEKGALKHTIIVSASAADPATLQYLAPFAGATIGEYFMDQGRDALVIYDDLSKHAVAYRQISLLLRRPPGREAYPGDVFYLHSRLLERAAKLSEEKGGGSLTALPIIETQAGDISAYIPTNVISITDGQIFLDADLFNKGNKPAINVGLSVSRVGSAAQTKAMKKVASRLRLELAQFRELEAFMQFSQDLDQATKERLERGERLSRLLAQGKGRPLSFEIQAALIYAGVYGLLDRVPIAEISGVEEGLKNFLLERQAELLSDIRESREISAQTEQKLRAAMESFLENH